MTCKVGELNDKVAGDRDQNHEKTKSDQGFFLMSSCFLIKKSMSSTHTIQIPGGVSNLERWLRTAQPMLHVSILLY